MVYDVGTRHVVSNVVPNVVPNAVSVGAFVGAGSLMPTQRYSDQ